MDLITSRDGTPIALWRHGAGQSLLLVHGATADHSTTWRLVLPELARHFAVHTVDRRGRGRSGDSALYDLQREAEDIACVVDAIGGPVAVLGHSYGALCSLEAALLTANVRRLLLYEGVPERGERSYQPGVIDRIEALIAAGDAEGALVSMYRDIVGMTPAEIQIMRSNADAWATRLVNVRAMPREASAEQSYSFMPERFADMTVPTFLLVGGDSPRSELENARAVAAGLPAARVVVLPGQHHVAMHTAPELFVREVTRILFD